jgi:asparagine synthase (glutamine-hydrolysing)
MCGFACVVDLSGKGYARAWALDRLRHRGPDGEGIFEDATGTIALEHTRLAIIDPDNDEADQPFSDPSGRWTIVYNGEIFNFREVRRDLERRGIAFRTNSDTEVLLQGFIEEGERILPRLRGMFAFVIWDRETGDLFCARDQVGVKPFYYLLKSSRFAACSEVRPLMTLPGCSPELDPAAVVEFLAFGDNLSDRTIVRDVFKLAPGHWLKIRKGQVQIEEWWDVLPTSGDAPDADHIVEDLARELDDAVSASLVSDVPLGIMLSGGIDSSLVAALAARHLGHQELTAYSVAFGRPNDEAASAARLANDLHMRHRVVWMTESDVEADFDDWLSTLDYPCGNPTWIALSFMARAARADGIKVLLSGDGGDEIFGGYNRWMKYLAFHDRVWRRVPVRSRRAAGRLTRPFVSGLAGDIARRAAEGGELFVPSRPWHDDTLNRFLGPIGRASAAKSPPEESVDAMRRRFEQRSNRSDYLLWMSYVTLRTKLVEDYLHRLDKMAMRYSVEGRVPLLDPVLMRWAARVPQRVLVGRYRQKELLRRAAELVLPSYVLRRPKQGFCPPVLDWTQKLMYERQLLPEGPLFEDGLINPAALDELKPTNDRASFATWTLRTLVSWTQQHMTSAPALIPIAAPLRRAAR